MIIDMFDEYSDIKDDILAGAGMISYYTSLSRPTDYETVEENSVLNDWSTIHHRLYVNPGLTYFSNPHMSKLDVYEYELDMNKLCIFGDRIKGNWTTTIIPYVDITGDNVISELIASSFFSALNEDYSSANMFIYSAMSILGLYEEESIQYPRGNSLGRRSTVTRSLRT